MENDIIDVLTDRLRVLMREHNVKAAPLARRAQLNESAVRDILRGRSKNPGIVTLKKIASVLSLRPSALFEASVPWPVVGVVDGEGLVRDVADGDDVRTDLPNPFFFHRAGDYSVLVNKSSALEPMAFSGDYLIFENHGQGLREADLGRPCFCVLADGRRVVRVARVGDSPNRVHLAPLGLYGSAERDVEVESVSRILLTMPADFIPNLPEPTHEGVDTLQEAPAAYAAPRR